MTANPNSYGTNRVVHYRTGWYVDLSEARGLSGPWKTQEAAEFAARGLMQEALAADKRSNATQERK